MSQSHTPTDSQGLLQSMLQRLKLQPGREGQPLLHTPVPATAASTWRQDGERGASTFQKVNNSPVNGFEFGTNGVPSKGFGISAADGNVGFKGREIQRPGHGLPLTSLPTQKDNTDNGTGGNRVLGQATSPGITPTGTGQLFPSQSVKDANITSLDRTDGERVSFGSSSTTRHTPDNNDVVISSGQNQGFKPKVYAWSLKATDAHFDTGNQEIEAPHVGNGGFGALGQSKDMQFVTSGQTTANSSFRRKRSSENKTRRWTQKIKERWLDRSGSLSKKGKEEGGRVDRKIEQGTEISPQKQLLTTENLINTSIKEEERPLVSLDSSDPSETPQTHTEDSTAEARIRSSSDFDFGLGSFSLLDEIVTGQEWAKFLNPSLPATSADQRPPAEPLNQFKTAPNPYDGGQSSLNLQGGGNNLWRLTDTPSSPDLDFSMAQISPDAFQTVSMDVSEGKQQQNVQPEPMEDSHNQSDHQSRERGRGQQRRPLSFVEPADTLDNSSLRRGHLNRKRHHQSAESPQTEKMSDGKEAGRGASVSPPSMTSSHVMDETGESQHYIVMPLYPPNSPTTPVSPSAFNPFAPAPRGVLKHSISQDSESTMETVTKRRRVEENRRVRFSEQVMTIAPPELELDAADSEEDSGAEEDSVTEQECEVEQAVMGEVAPARRAALPAWIQALKRRNMGRKNR
ncbi:uncharacterized protein AKAME5_002155300 [Lates japonicus]|uniref:Uncharacterized protein n=1 Tax=Lates japonicus TaxID=270547 RepID=A0AAD3NFG8_LATJO|nr:uncharacterized protein AKAME5_002155300 [Lates japonicus]